jgi:hypothetical protein
VDEVEAAGCRPQLVHARKAKLMLGTVNKTDRVPAILSRNARYKTPGMRIDVRT